MLQHMIEAHPDYLFGISNYILNIEEEEKMRAAGHYLGENKKITDLREDKDYVFHVSEFQSYQFALAVYYSVLGITDKATDALLPLIELEYPESLVRNMAEKILAIRTKRGAERHAAADNKRRQTMPIPAFPTDVTDKMPEFNHPEVRLFYEVSTENLQDEDRKKIAALPREALVEDLEKILQDAIDRYDKLKNKRFNEDTQSAPLHSLYFLSAFEHEESLPQLLNLLRINDEFIEYWFDIQATSDLRNALFALGKNKLSALSDFLKEKHRGGFVRTIVAEAVIQIGVHYPDRRPEIIDLFKDIFDFYLVHAEDSAYADTDFISMTLAELEYLSAVELEGYVHRFDEKGLIDDFMAGTAAEIAEMICTEPHPWQRKPVPENLAEYYDGSYRERRVERPMPENEPAYNMFTHPVEKIIMKLMMGIIADEFEDPEKPRPRPSAGRHIPVIPETVKRTAPKVGRNEPCPCGSGKKYKKCCLNK